MKSESMIATEKMLEVVNSLLDEQQPESLFPKILEVAKSVLHADEPSREGVAGEHGRCSPNADAVVGAEVGLHGLGRLHQ